MPPEPRDGTSALDDTIFSIGVALADLDPGALASLRRMSLEGDDYGAPYFWRLASRHDFGKDERLAAWARIVQIMAILTDKGASDAKRSPHDRRHGLGHSLCDGGDTDWGKGEPEARPRMSEVRFARMLAAKGRMRAELMIRAARTLAASKPPGIGVNCVDLARILLHPDNQDHVRHLARSYYARLDRVRSAAPDAKAQAPAAASGDAP